MSSGSQLLAPKSRGSLTGRAAVLALVFGLLVLTLAVPVRTWFAQRAEISGLEANVAAARDRVVELQILQERWTDPAFVVAEARRRLHFVMPGEVGYTTMGADALPAAGPALMPAAVSWYVKLWTAVEQADRLTPAAATTP
ncbi:MAG: septum formation initiator family protein [Candidatus Nanopelagicales bacterium]|nr:septum formation initiator family protein [Candidatus Nanopelagicales bacterium]